jgi:hypothetical protein
LGVGLLGVLGNHDLALEDRLGSIVDYGLEGFAALAIGHDVINIKRQIAVLAVGDHGDAGDIKARLLTGKYRTGLGAGDPPTGHNMQQLGLCACGKIERDLAEMDSLIALVLHAQD